MEPDKLQNPDEVHDEQKNNELTVEEFSITELEDRLEFVLRCDNRCNL